MTRNPTTTTPDSTLESAAQLMWTDNRAFLPVVDRAGRVVGVLTDRDVSMCAYTQGRRLAELDVGTAMAKNVICARTSDSPAAVEELLLANHVHRVPVLDGEGVLVGVVSLSRISETVRGKPERGDHATLATMPLSRFAGSAKRGEEQRKGS